MTYESILESDQLHSRTFRSENMIITNIMFGRMDLLWANDVDPDQFAKMNMLIWVYAGPLCRVAPFISAFVFFVIIYIISCYLYMSF